jgi:hypothetical protein
MIRNFERYVTPVNNWDDWEPGKGFKQLLPKQVSPEDRLLSEMIQNMDFLALYRSIEFREKLRKRLDFYKSLSNE